MITPADLQIITAVVMGLFGLLWGSFFNVCIYRIPAGLSVVTPRSYCYRCGSMVSAFDNIPVLSYLLLGGACRHCGTPYSARYMGVELLTGCIFGWVGYTFGGIGPSAALLLYALFAGLMIVATFTDLDHFIIPDGISVGGGLALIALTALIGALGQSGVPMGLIYPVAVGWPFDHLPALAGRPWWVPGLAALAGGLGGAFLLYGIGVIGKIIFRKDAMGFGDVKLMLGIGAVLGPLHTVASFFAACVIGSVLSITWVVIQRALGNRQRVLREEYAPMGGDIEDARAQALQSPSEPDSDEDLDMPGDEPPAPERDATTEMTHVHGNAMAAASKQPAPYTFTHLPFGPYLAIGALVVLMYHQRVTSHLDEVMRVLEIREYPTMSVRWNDGGGDGYGGSYPMGARSRQPE